MILYYRGVACQEPPYPFPDIALHHVPQNLGCLRPLEAPNLLQETQHIPNRKRRRGPAKLSRPWVEEHSDNIYDPGAVLSRIRMWCDLRLRQERDGGDGGVKHRHVEAAVDEEAGRPEEADGLRHGEVGAGRCCGELVGSGLEIGEGGGGEVGCVPSCEGVVERVVEGDEGGPEGGEEFERGREEGVGGFEEGGNVDENIEEEVFGCFGVGRPGDCFPFVGTEG